MFSLQKKQIRLSFLCACRLVSSRLVNLLRPLLSEWMPFMGCRCVFPFFCHTARGVFHHFVSLPPVLPQVPHVRGAQGGDGQPASEVGVPAVLDAHGWPP